MPVRFMITDAKQISDGLWEASVSPEEVRLLGPVSFSHPGPSVLLLTASPGGAGDGAIEVQPLGVAVLNAGTLPRVIMVAGTGAHGGEGHDAEAASADDGNTSADSLSNGSQAWRPGDAAFLSATAPSMRPLAERLLARVRQEFPGELVYKAGSGRFVETPDNWWTVKPQPVAKSFRFTVRARVGALSDLGLSKLAQDRTPSYSAFVMEGEDELPTVMAGLGRAAQNRNL